jgi:trimeric autotransporter adhesin
MRHLFTYLVLTVNYLLVTVNCNAQIISTVAGGGSCGSTYCGDGGQATNAELNYPVFITFDAAGNLFIADQANNRVRKVSTTGVITSVAGYTAAAGFSGDGGPATAAKLYRPTGVAIDGAGNLYFSDAQNHRIRMVNASGIINTIAGTGTAAYGGDGGPATMAQFNNPDGIKFDIAGNLYIADIGNSRIRMINTSGIITTVAGNGTAAFSGDGGPATSAELYAPQDIALDAVGNLYISDSYNHRIRKVNTSGVISTFAGNGVGGSSGDGGLATNAELGQPVGLVADTFGSIYVTDADFSNSIRKINSTGVINTIVSNFNGPAGVAFDAAGSLYFVETGYNLVHKITNAAQIDIKQFSGVNSGVLVYPNPAKDVLTIEYLGLSERAVLKITNMLGEEVAFKTIGTTKEKSQVDVTALEGGVYFIQIETKERIIVKKIIKN